MDRAKKEMPDFIDVVASPELTAVFSKAMDGFCVEFDVDGKIQYHLGKNLEEAERIFKMTPIGQLRVMGKLADRFYPDESAKDLKPTLVPKKQSAASPPPSTVGGNASVIEDESKAALAAGDFSRFAEIENRKDIERAKLRLGR